MGRRRGLGRVGISTVLVVLVLIVGCNPAVPIRRTLAIKVESVADGGPAGGRAVLVTTERGVAYLREGAVEQRTVYTDTRGLAEPEQFSCDGDRFFALIGGPTISDNPPPLEPLEVRIEHRDGDETLTIEPVPGFTVTGELYRVIVQDVGLVRRQSGQMMCD